MNAPEAMNLAANMRRKRQRAVGWRHAVLLASLCTPGCLMGGLRVEEVATSAERPANVAVYLSVTRKGAPVTGLPASSFVISEDGQVVPPEQTKQVLLSSELAAVHRALLLVDMSGPVNEGDTRARIESAAAMFVTRARTTLPVSVFAFDGGPALRFVADFQTGAEPVTAIPALASFTPGDTSSNLNGAVIEALTKLDARLMSTQKPIRIGTLVIFARGPDLAGRVTEAKVSEVLDDTKHQTFAIAVAETPGLRPGALGDDGVFTAKDAASLVSAFEEAGTRVADTVAQHYLLSYCSPARAGVRRLRIEVATKDEKGEDVEGSLSTEFDAAGFTAGCDPNTTPRFVVRAKAERETDIPDSADAKTRGQRPARPAGTAPASGAGPARVGPGADAEDDDVVPPPAKPGYAQ